MATTPPPPSASEIQTPPAPKYGSKYDSYEPYVPRQSARLASQRSSRERHSTPPPVHPRGGRNGGRSERNAEPRTRGLSPATPSHRSPQKNGLGRLGRNDNSYLEPTSSYRASNGMLPTPAKTPKKKTIAGDMSTTSRTLFPSSLTPGRGKKGKPSGMSVESYGDEPGAGDSKIEIYTDFRDRIPEAHEGNPFYRKPGSPTRAREAEETNRDPDVRKVLERDDGMLYVL